MPILEHILGSVNPLTLYLFTQEQKVSEAPLQSLMTKLVSAIFSAIKAHSLSGNDWLLEMMVDRVCCSEDPMFESPSLLLFDSNEQIATQLTSMAMDITRCPELQASSLVQELTILLVRTIVLMAYEDVLSLDTDATEITNSYLDLLFPSQDMSDPIYRIAEHDSAMVVHKLIEYIVHAEAEDLIMNDIVRIIRESHGF